MLCVCVCVSFRVVLLLLSSGYIGLRIVALEEQLTSLGALPGFTFQSGYKPFDLFFFLFIPLLPCFRHTLHVSSATASKPFPYRVLFAACFLLAAAQLGLSCIFPTGATKTHNTGWRKAEMGGSLGPFPAEHSGRTVTSSEFRTPGSASSVG